jgi:DNA-binding winged helix-turn-helix (wHTH) protein
MGFRFGDCFLDDQTRQLLVRGEPVHISPKAFQFLELLLENRPRALAKAEIHDRLWKDTFVSDGTLTSLLAEIRSAIGDDPRESRFVRTVHRFGYAFSGDAHESSRPAGRAEAARLVYRLFLGPREIALDEGENVLGRDPEVTVWIDSRSVSRKHAEIRIQGDTAVLVDLESKNGTYLGGERVESARPLSDGDEIRVGSISLTFRVFSLPESTQTVDGP